ncbi:nitrilase-related carbon-nitrogen hydrolase [Bacillus norwichensis]|uniref:nitrilase-related carbon-nitrogen hydrolase n=1 Tax=Bacillus norwichensis TaxID=2762217 RepID=UPI00296F5756|nr:nitrilase-related carbon-nitrogen hydrolase [Bacillus norwichensis]
MLHASPVCLELGATVEKTCTMIEVAANNGAKLVGFAEAFISGYPWWVFAVILGHRDPFLYKVLAGDFFPTRKKSL